MELAQPGAPWRAQAGTTTSIPPEISDPATGNDAKHVAPSAAAGAEQVSGDKIEITLPDGTSVKVGHDVSLETFRRVMTVLRR
jgi:hypothetical protein